MIQQKADERWIGQILNRNYRIDSVLGKGGQAIIYRGVDLILGEDIAIKQFLKKGEQENLERFKREARHQMKLVHQNIVGTRAIIEEAEEYFIVMEYIDGTDLGHLISVSVEQPCLPLNQIRKIFEEVLEALGYAHQQGVIHRDIKPPNIMLTQDYKVKLADFGLARQLQDQRLTVAGQLLGTPAYTAPEILQGASTLDPRCDIYSIGVSLYETICGTTPFLNPGEALAPYELMGRHMFMEPTNPREKGVMISKELEEVIMQSIAKDPEQRFANCEDFRDALSSAMVDATQLWNIQQNAQEQDFSRDTTIIQRPEFAKHAEVAAPITTSEKKTEHDVAAIPMFLQNKLHDPSDDPLDDSDDASIQTQLDEPAASEHHFTPDSQTQPELRRVPTQRPNPFRSNPMRWIIPIGAMITLLGVLLLLRKEGFVFSSKQKQPIDTRNPVRTKLPDSIPKTGIYPQKIPGVAMIYIPEGKVVIGKEISSKSGGSFRPVYGVFLSAFWIDQFEVTTKQYRMCVKEGTCRNRPSLRLSRQTRDDVPITRVTWSEANNFCQWMGKELPTEAQWEKAARGPKGYNYPWGNSEKNCDYAHRCGCRSRRALPVGPDHRRPGRSYYDVFDMAGNVMEWTRDCYSFNAYRTMSKKDPVRLREPCDSRILRGGSYHCEYSWLLFSYTRLGIRRDIRRRDIGFRCAWTPIKSPS